MINIANATTAIIGFITSLIIYYVNIIPYGIPYIICTRALMLPNTRWPHLEEPGLSIAVPSLR